MKKLVMFLGALALVFGVMGSAQATPFSNSVDFNNRLLTSSVFTYFHTDLPSGIDSASLTLTFRDDQVRFLIWSWDDTGDEKVRLTYNNGQVIDLGDVNTNVPRSIGIETSSLGESLEVDIWAYSGDAYLDRSVLSGTYQEEIIVQGNLPNGNQQDGNTAPVPEPATMLLLGSGLAGIAGLRKKFKK